MFLSFFKKVYSTYFIKLLELLLIILLVMLASTTILQVFCRYVLNRSLPWPGEIAGFILVWITYIGSSLALYHNQHIGFNLLINKITEKHPVVGISIRSIYNIILSCLFIMISWYSIPVVQRTWNSSVYTVYFLKKGWVYLVIPVAFLIMAMFNFIKTVKTIINIYSGEPWEHLWAYREDD